MNWALKDLISDKLKILVQNINDDIINSVVYQLILLFILGGGIISVCLFIV